MDPGSTPASAHLRLFTNVTEHEETRLKTHFPIVYNAHIKVKSVFYFVLKSILLSDKKEKKNLQDNAGFFC